MAIKGPISVGITCDGCNTLENFTLLIYDDETLFIWHIDTDVLEDMGWLYDGERVYCPLCLDYKHD